MYQIDLNQPVHVHFIGIGGISMSGLAEILLSKGFFVSGSDRSETELTKKLTNNGAHIFYGQRSSNITEEINVVVYTAAISDTNPEFVRAKELNLPMLSRAQLLGQLMKNYKLPVAVSGTHGKTTTTSLLAELLLAEDADPTLSIGGILKSIDGNTRIGGTDYFVFEACEYTNSFLSFFPKISIILNIEEDHLDFFKDLADIRNSFHEFAKLLPSDGTLIINGEIPDVQEFVKDLDCQVITYGRTEECDYQIKQITYNEFACPTFVLRRPDKSESTYSIKVTGEHNACNAAAALVFADLCGISEQAVNKAFSSYTGANRRFEFKGSIGGVNVIDDYAHHPTEIKATLTAAQRYPHKSIWCVFQPHTYTRTKAFLDEFAEALSLADHVVLAPIYAARETDTLGISSKTLLEKLLALGADCTYYDSFDEIETALLLNCENNDMLITMGAGDVHKIGEKLLGI